MQFFKCINNYEYEYCLTLNKVYKVTDILSNQRLNDVWIRITNDNNEKSTYLKVRFKNLNRKKKLERILK
jgi:hypothetical protein